MPYLRHGKVESGWPDVGFIEITSADALTFLGKQAIGIDRFAVQGCGNPNRPCFLYGYPAALVRTQGGQTTPDRIFTPMCYMPTPTSPERFPEVSSGDPGTDRALDIFVPYDQSENMWHFENSKGDVQLVDAPGISGGGVWQGTSGEGQVWSPGHRSTYRHPKSLESEQKYARGCQIVHWLRLIYEQYGDLQPLLSGTSRAVSGLTTRCRASPRSKKSPIPAWSESRWGIPLPRQVRRSCTSMALSPQPAYFPRAGRA